MIGFICLFLPAVLGVCLFEQVQKSRLSRRQWLYRYCANVVFINSICFAIKRFLLGTAHEPFCSLYADITPAVGLNYLIIAIPAAVLLAFLQLLLAKHTAITVEDEENA